MIYDRALVPIEQAMELLNRSAGSYNVVTLSRIQGPLTPAILRQALDMAQARHPRLNSRIVGSLDALRFETEGTQPIPLRVVHKQDCEQWQEVVLEEMNERIESSKGMLRAVLVEFSSEPDTHYLLTSLHHAITDGLSGIQLHSELLTYCMNLATGAPVAPAPSLPALPAVNDLLPASMRGFKATINSMSFLLRLTLKKLWYRPKSLGFEQYVPTEQRRCGMVHRQLDPELTQQLVEQCRAEHVTVQSALCAAMLLTVASKITEPQTTDVRLSCQSFVNLRQYLTPAVSREHLSVLASFVPSFHTVSTHTSLWELAREVKQQLNAGLKQQTDLFVPVLLFRKLVESLLAQPQEVPVTVALSNVGRVTIPSDYGLFQLKEISYVPAQAVFGGVFAAAVSTFAGTMRLNFIFSEPAISHETMEILVDRTLDFVRAACDRPSTSPPPTLEPAQLSA